MTLGSSTGRAPRVERRVWRRRDVAAEHERSVRQLERHQLPELRSLPERLGGVRDGVEQPADDRVRLVSERAAAPSGVLEDLGDRVADGRVDRAGNERLQPDLLVQADLCVGQQHVRRLPARVLLCSRGRIRLERVHQERLAAALARPRAQLRRERVEGGRLVIRGERNKGPGKQWRELAEDGQIAGGNRLRDVADRCRGRRRGSGWDRGWLPSRRGRARRSPGRARPDRLELAEQRPERAGHLLLADEPARGSRGPRGERAPVRVLAAERARERVREVVVPLRDQKVPADGLPIEPNDPLDVLAGCRADVHPDATAYIVSDHSPIVATFEDWEPSMNDEKRITQFSGVVGTSTSVTGLRQMDGRICSEGIRFLEALERPGSGLAIHHRPARGIAARGLGPAPFQAKQFRRSTSHLARANRPCLGEGKRVVSDEPLVGEHFFARSG